MTKIKICGITNLEDALASLFSGADAIGFVFYKKSPRYISPICAGNISRILPKKISRVGVFVDEDIKTVKKIARVCGLDMLQFHGRETAAYCRKFKGYKVIKAFTVRDRLVLDKIPGYKGCACLFDAYLKGRPGGTGKKFNWNLLRKLDKIKALVFLSGGLTAGNVGKAIKLLKPDWVDASSALESKPGKKDHRKIKEFINKCRQL
jgi:phosphoribosylanthranilate isomerase